MRDLKTLVSTIAPFGTTYPGLEEGQRGSNHLTSASYQKAGQPLKTQELRPLGLGTRRPHAHNEGLMGPPHAKQGHMLVSDVVQ